MIILLLIINIPIVNFIYKVINYKYKYNGVEANCIRRLKIEVDGVNNISVFVASGNKVPLNKKLPIL